MMTLEEQAALVRSLPLHKLTAWEKQFVRSLGLLLHNGKRLSLNQVAHLEKMRDEVRTALAPAAIQTMPDAS